MIKIHQHTHGYQYWYDRTTRSWWGAKFRREGGRQLTPALYAFTKDEIIQLMNEEIEDAKNA